MSQDDIRACDEMTRAINEYNARMQEGVDQMLLSLARWALGIVGGGVLGPAPLGRCLRWQPMNARPVAVFDDTQIEPWHLPHFDLAVCGIARPCLTERHLDARQQELVTASMPLPDLLLKTGAMSGPFKRTKPITRWTRAARRFTRALLAFLLAPSADLKRKP